MSFGLFASSNHTADIHIKKGSLITISGKSNVNKFSCAYTTTIAPGCQIVDYNYLNNTISLNRPEIKLKSKSFDCGGRMINRDFNKLMQSEDYPFITIAFTKISIMKGYFEVNTVIEIADQSQAYTFNIFPRQNTNYIGTLKLNINDFDMKAPKKLLGTIQVNPNISIEFDLNLDIK